MSWSKDIVCFDNCILDVVVGKIVNDCKRTDKMKSFLPRLPTKRVKFLDSIPESNEAETSMSASAHSDSMVVESGPVEYDEHDDGGDDDDDEDVHLSAAQLMGQEYGQGDEYEDFDNY